MLFKQKLRKNFTFLITLFILLQLVASTFENLEYSDGSNFFAEKSDLICLNNVVQTNISIFIKDSNRKKSYLLTSVVFFKYVVTNYIAGISRIKLFYFTSFIDFRKEIRKTIPNYFNGSKYKQWNPFI